VLDREHGFHPLLLRLVCAGENPLDGKRGGFLIAGPSRDD
jgi:hypothetical protein